jgi:IMP dehydrogenase
MEITKGYDFDDVLLIPRESRINSRESVDVSTMLGNTELKIPIIAAPMKGIVGVDLIIELGKVGGLGILPRFYNDQQERNIDISRLERACTNYGVAVGLKDTVFMEAMHAGACVICIDVANGYIDSVCEFIQTINDYRATHDFNCVIMAGNVATYEGANKLYKAGAEVIRVGIGSGALCITRNMTGVGVPQITAINDCAYVPYIKELGTSKNARSEWITIADGGIRNSGDAVKALAAGGDAVMIGTLFESCIESDHDGEIRGMASKEHQEQFYGEVKKSVEGIQRKAAEKIIPLSKFIDKFIWNMKSAFTYLNAKNIDELHENAYFTETGKGSIK